MTCFVSGKHKNILLTVISVQRKAANPQSGVAGTRNFDNCIFKWLLINFLLIIKQLVVADLNESSYNMAISIIYLYIYLKSYIFRFEQEHDSLFNCPHYRAYSSLFV